ncbi:hypothetical protein [Agrobacterium sp. NPDC089420]|uniref:hypothetical protein n=1 Tax=Agrobacterium sp. NPDC089420 TaxID=3363918 RepID=UPI00384E65BD
MTYTALFENSKIDLLVEGIGNDLKEVAHLMGESLDTPAKYLQSAGSALQQSNNPRAVALGEILDGVGKSLETGSTVYIEGISPDAVAKVFIGMGVGAVTGIGVLAAVSFVATIALALSPVPALWLGLLAMSPIGNMLAVGVLAIALYFADEIFTSPISDWIFDNLYKPLLQILADPLILDLDGDGVELVSLDVSNVHFDYDGDGFAEKTGWVSPDDGILVDDKNSNGKVDGAYELFGSASKDGFAVLETLDSNRDGKISADDEVFDRLKIWRDLNQNGVTDDGELLTLTEAGIESISLDRAVVDGTNTGHGVGFQASFNWASGALGVAQSIYFQTDRQDTRSDNTPDFTASEIGVMLPQLPGSGQINSIL